MARGEGLRVRLMLIPGVTNARAFSGKLYFPAVTGDFEYAETAQHNDYQTIAAGEFSAPAGGNNSARQLRTWTMEVIAPQTPGGYPWLVDQSATFEDVQRALFGILRWKTPVDFLASRDLTGRAELACDCTIRSVSRVMRHAQLGLRYFAVEFTEWRDTSLRRRSADASPPKSLFAPALPTTIRLAASDTADSLARRYYGHPALATIIIKANHLGRWGRTTPLAKAPKLAVGSRLTIPDPNDYLQAAGGITNYTVTSAVTTP